MEMTEKNKSSLSAMMETSMDKIRQMVDSNTIVGKPITTEDGTTQSFDTLSYEVAPISLLSVDAAAGATPISFTAPEQ
mgnify:CR=1 FL=1